MLWPKMLEAPTIVWLLIFALVSSNSDSMLVEEIQKHVLQYPCEIVVILDDSNSVSMEDFGRMVNLTRQLPNYFRMDDDHSRMSVVAFSTSSRIVLNLTSDVNLVRSLDPKRQGGGSLASKALKDIKESVFVDARPNASKVVIFITDGQPQDYLLVEKIAAEMRDAGNFLYVVAVGQAYKEKEEVKKLVANITGHPARVFLIEDFDDSTKDIFLPLKEQITCRFEEVCRFNDSQQQGCVVDWWQPDLTDLQCSNSPPDRFHRQCETSNCDVPCEKWEWEKPPCGRGAGGKSVVVNRNGPMPPPMEHQLIYQHCLVQKAVVCSPEEEEFPIWGIALLAVFSALLMLLTLLAIALIIRKRNRKVAATKTTRSTISRRSLAFQYGSARATAEHSMAVSLAGDAKYQSIRSTGPRPSLKSATSKAGVLSKLARQKPPAMPKSVPSKSTAVSKMIPRKSTMVSESIPPKTTSRPKKVPPKPAAVWKSVHSKSDALPKWIGPKFRPRSKSAHPKSNAASKSTGIKQSVASRPISMGKGSAKKKGRANG